jgi:hypothetical protein
LVEAGEPMPWTVKQRREYQAAWRARNPTYQRELKTYRRRIEGQWRAEFEAKVEKIRPLRRSSSGRSMTTSGAVREAYPWETE